MEVVSSCLTNHYFEGSSGRGYHGGNEFIDEWETLCQRRTLAALRLNGKRSC